MPDGRAKNMQILFLIQPKVLIIFEELQRKNRTSRVYLISCRRKRNISSDILLRRGYRYLSGNWKIVRKISEE